MSNAPVDLKAIRCSGESGAFVVLLIGSILTIVILSIGILAGSLVGLLLYVAAIVLFVWISKALAMASIRGHGIRVSSEQYPVIYQYVKDFSARLDLKKEPEVYVLQATLMNAFATKVIGRHYVVLYSHLVDAALESGDYDEVAMILAHEMGHHAAGHVRWSGILQLAFWIPFLHLYWSRRCEYTCDRIGLLLVGKVAPSVQGMVKLAVGRKLAASTNLSALRRQKEQVGGEFGPKLVEIFSSHPLTIKRITGLEDFAAGQHVN